MRLLGPYMFVFVGVIIGIATTYLYKNPLRAVPNIFLAVVGSFFGLWLRDIMDWHIGGNLRGALIAAALGALVLTMVANMIVDRDA